MNAPSESIKSDSGDRSASDILWVQRHANPALWKINVLKIPEIK